MKSSTLIPVAALATLGQATWPFPSRASNLTTHGPSSLPPLATISLPGEPPAPSSSSSHRAVEAHTFPSLSTAHSLATHPSGVASSASSFPATHRSSSRRRIVYHTLPSPPVAHSSSSHQSVVAHSLSNLSAAHTPSSHPLVTGIILSRLYSAGISSSQPAAATVSDVDVSPSSKPCVCYGDHHDPTCCHEVTITRIVLIPAPTTVVDYDDKTRTVTKDSLRMGTDLQPNLFTAAVMELKTRTTCKPSPATWDPPRRPIRPYPSSVPETIKKPGPTPWEVPRKPHGTIRPYPSDDKREHQKPTYAITTFGPEATCPAGFTCQPDDDLIEAKLAVREASVPWPAPPGCINRCVGGRGCWTECDKRHPNKPSRICPEGYSCREKKPDPAPAPVPVPEPPRQQPPHKPRPAPKKQPVPTAPHPEHPPGPAPMPPPAIHSPPEAPPPVVVPPFVPLRPVPSPPTGRSVVSPPPSSSPAVGKPPTAIPNPVTQPTGAPARPSTHSKPTSKVPPVPSPHCPVKEDPCQHRYANETIGAPETVTKAGAGLPKPDTAMAMMLAGGFAGGFGFFMV